MAELRAIGVGDDRGIVAVLTETLNAAMAGKIASVAVVAVETSGDVWTRASASGDLHKTIGAIERLKFDLLFG